MSQIKNQKQFAELEYCILHYFDGKISPVMNQVKADLNSKQTKELADYLKSPRGVLASVITSYSIHYTKLYEMGLLSSRLHTRFTSLSLDIPGEYSANRCGCSLMKPITLYFWVEGG